MAADDPGADPSEPAALPARRARRGDAWFLVAAVVTLALGVVGALDWTLIPRGLDDNLRGIAEPDDGPDFITFYTDESAGIPTFSVYVDRFGGPEWLYGQQPMRKDPWSRTLTVGGRSVDLAPPAVFYQYLAVLAALVAVAVLRWRRRPVLPAG